MAVGEHRVRKGLVVAALALGLGGCAAEVSGFVNDKSVTARAATTEAVVGEDGRCTADLSIDPALFRGRDGDGLIGLTECELVALKGEPLSVQTGASSSAKRETTMLYMEPTGKAIYLFANNRLVRVVR
ncbi:hypothetical protein NK718_17230 [Alsobacter sp. SYSU M60028]|uniref:Lipoprotein n=1 Tax=Alsobacter ponti TaxID=2962936 RepID=A0ABT1LGQ9_9HYPH|nr:hypothetical protein [Alsobacter ponti]MCP8940271.1 hypothetical protein [Alsobacter ponti]